MRWWAITFLASFLGSGVIVASDISADQDGFQPIFDGKTLEGWDGNPKFWHVEDGAITGQTTSDNPTKGNTFIIWRQNEVDDFELKLEYRIFGGNSGIQYRSFEVKDQKWVVGGYQGDLEAGDTWSGALYGERYRGILAARGQKTVIGADHKPKVVGKIGDRAALQRGIRKEDWNEYHIIAKGNRFVHKINGQVMVEVLDEDEEVRRRNGILALQLHAGPPMKVQFRNIRLKRLKMPDRKKVVFVAGKPSHGYGSHEHNAGCLLLAKKLNESVSNMTAVVHLNGWPSDPTALDNADAVVVYCDGGGNHLLNRRLGEFAKLMKKGVGLACLHYAVEVPKGEAGGHFLNWIGGYFEKYWSVNPHWTAQFTELPKHEITKGVEPFSIEDEWYYHMRFRAEMEGVAPILTAVPPASTLNRKDGSHSNNRFVRATIGQPQHVAWATERAEGGRGFGFTGGHFHKNWADDNFRKIVLNAIVWVAKGDIPEGGVTSKTPTVAEIEANQDFPKPAAKRANSTTKVAPVSLPKVQKQTEQRRDAADAVAGLDVGDGLEATLFAAEPMLLSPTNIDVDYRGRVWVCEVQNYRHRQGTRPAGDRILILEDQDGDGKADRKKVYYQGRDIDSAMGIGVFGNRVIVSCSPNVFVFTDLDGDDKPDRKDLLFTKTGQPQHDHSAHAFLFGPDGKFYWNMGNTGKAVFDKHGKPVVDLRGYTVNDQAKPYRQGMAFRCNMDGSEFEVLGHNFRNNYELTVDSFGAVWQSDNDDDGNRGVRINFVMEFGNYGYVDEVSGAGWRSPRTGMHADIPLRHWHLRDPGVVPNLLQTGSGSPTGICVYEGRLLPKVYWDQVIHCDAGPNIVRAYPVKPSGAGYSARMVNVLAGTRDNWFRPADVCVAPDGSLFVADWYDPGVGGHRMGDVDKGRIFRIAPPGASYELATPDLTSLAGCIEAMKSANLATRYIAWQNIHDWSQLAPRRPRIEAGLKELLASHNQRHRARALWLLAKIPGRAQTYARKAIADSNPDIRMTGLRMARSLKLDLIPLVAELVDDPSAQVRRECAIALNGLRGSEATRLWAKLALRHDGEDRWYLEALGIGAEGNWDEALRSWLELVGENWNQPGGRDIIWRSRAEATPQLLASLIRASDRAADLPRYLRAFDFLNGESREATLAALAFGTKEDNGDHYAMVAAEAINRLGANAIRNSPKHRAALNRILDQNAGTQSFVNLVERFEISDRYSQLVQIAQENPANELGVQAVSVLLGKRQFGILNKALNSHPEKAAINLAIALGNSADGRIAGLLTPLLSNEQSSLELRRQAVRAVAKTRNGARQVIELTREGKLDAQLKSAAAAQLATARWRDLQPDIAKLFPLPASKDAKPLPPVSALLEMKGDAVRGKKVFETTGTCAKCHRVNGVGTEVGPDLSEIGKKLSRDALLESILFPSAGINFNYETYAIETESGNLFSGIITSETGDSITLKTQDGLSRTIPKSEVASKVQQSISLMPDDIQKTMSAEEVMDVVAYMVTLRQAKK